MTKVGAVYCVYDDSGFLAESIGRIYPLVEKVIILSGATPWQGNPDPTSRLLSVAMSLGLPDPEGKIEVVCGVWKNEADQRNYGLRHLHSLEIPWCCVIDDDEMFNRSEFKWAVDNLDSLGQQAYLIHHQIYWKRRDLIVGGFQMALPAFAKTEPGIVRFNENRMILVRGTWITHEPKQVICHHLSYVRSDEKMLKKITNFSHASSIGVGWYDKVWLGWGEGMGNLHPTQPKAFPHTEPPSAFILEPYTQG